MSGGDNDINALLLQSYRSWDHIVNIMCNSRNTYRLNSHHNDSFIYLKKHLVTSNSRKTNSMGISLTRKRFGAMVLAVFSWVETLHDLRGAILLEINGDIVCLESYQSITSRWVDRRIYYLPHMIHFRITNLARPIHFSFLVNERILDVVFWEREIGIVWGPCSDVAQVTVASLQHLSHNLALI